MLILIEINIKILLKNVKIIKFLCSKFVNFFIFQFCISGEQNFCFDFC